MAYTSIGTLLAAVVAGLFAGRAAHWTKKQSEASNDQVRIATENLEVAKSQAAVAQEFGAQEVEIGRLALDAARSEAKATQEAAERQAQETKAAAERQLEVARSALERQVQEAQVANRRYEESRLDAVVPVVLATVRRPGAFIEARRRTADGEWPTNWTSIEVPTYIEENQQNETMFRIRLDVILQNVSDQIARIEIIDPARGEVNVKSGKAIIVRPRGEAVFTWIRGFTPGELSSQTEIDKIENCFFSVTLWVRDLGMNVRDTYKFNADLRLFSRDGSRFIVRPEPEHSWQEDFAQPLQERHYERLEAHHSGSVSLTGSGNLSSDG